MDKFELVIPTAFGIEAIVAREVRDLGYETTSVEDGRITFLGDVEAICRANIWVRSGERVLIKVGEFTAVTFDELFEKTKALPWSDWLPKNCAFPVKGHSIRSKLFSISDCQSIIKKSIVDSLGAKYKISWFEEDGETYQIQFNILKDKVTLTIDTTGMGLHKRGYRPRANEAPIRETLASAMVKISNWRANKPLCDPLCGSGTIPIEAAMIARNIAPGLYRNFSAEHFGFIPKFLWTDTREAAEAAIKNDLELNIYAYDIDTNSVELAKENSRLAKVSENLKISQMPLIYLNLSESLGVLICNPPYGERMGEEHDVADLYKEMGKVFRRLDRWSHYIITSNEKFEVYYGKRADKKRKLYNGMIKCDYYQYFR